MIKHIKKKKEKTNSDEKDNSDDEDSDSDFSEGIPEWTGCDPRWITFLRNCPI